MDAIALALLLTTPAENRTDASSPLLKKAALAVEVAGSYLVLEQAGGVFFIGCGGACQVGARGLGTSEETKHLHCLGRAETRVSWSLGTL
jgi:hypothetical protein